ncbi:Nicotianamine aminotransferase B [Metarhizium anisopliae]|nr:Nicotianamine aminotransferase B [Metarhizium anisopliae]
MTSLLIIGALSIVQLRQLSATPRADAIDPDLKLDYGPFEGSAKLRMCIAELHSTPEVPSKPNNQIETTPPRSFLEEVVALAKRFNIAIFCDEVLTPLFRTDDPTPPPIESLGYENSISIGPLSKAWGLPGVRAGWVISRNAALLRKILIARDYTTISVSRLDDGVAAYALGPEVRRNLLKHHLALCRESIALLDEFVRRNKRCRRTTCKPQGGGTGFIQILGNNGEAVDHFEFGLLVVKEPSLLAVPCSFCFRDGGTNDSRGYLRFPLGDSDVLRKGLPLLEKVLKE